MKRSQFPLYKLFLIVAAYAAALGAFVHLGVVGFVIAVLVGTAAGWLIVLFRKQQTVPVVVVAVCALVGAFFGFMFLSPWMFLHPYTFPQAPFERITGDVAAEAIGVVLGGLFGSWVNRMEPRD